MQAQGSPDAGRRSIDFLCEEERIRRLGERIRRDRDDSSELSRERRARGLARELLAVGFGNELTRDASRPLASASEFLPPMPLGPPPIVELPTTAPAPAMERASAHAPAPQALAPQAPTLPVPRAEVSTSFPSAPMDPKERLNVALDSITVKGIVEFRGLADATPEAEAVAVAALRLLAGQVRESEPSASPPPQTWFEVKRLLLKPGHFVNMLRRFPYAADRGQVPEADLCDVEEILAEVPPNGDGLEEFHAMAAQLYAWVRAALEYAAWSQCNLDTVATPARAAAAPAVDARSMHPPVPATRAAASPAWPTAPSGNGGYTAASGPGFGVSFAALAADDDLDPPLPRGAIPAAAAAVASRVSAAAPRTLPQSSAAYAGPGTFGGPAAVPGVGFGGAAQASAALARPRSPASPGKRAQGRGTAVASRAKSPVAAPPVDSSPLMAEESQENQRKLLQAKKEVREIRALESQLKWGMEREEKKQVEEAKREADVEIMEWRDDQAARMRECMAEQERIQTLEDLAASKEFQAFKRERKQVSKEEELQYMKERYQMDLENAQMQAEIAQAVTMDRHALVLENLENIEVAREMKADAAMLEKIEADQERSHDKRLQYQHEANNLCAEKEELLRNLQLMRSCQKKPVTSNRGLATAGRAAKR